MSIEKVTIERVNATDKNKEGVEYEGKYGKFWRVGIITKEYGDTWLNGFSNKEPTWIEGDVVDLDVTTEETEKYGKQLKFRIPKKEDLKDEKIKELEKKLAENTEATTELSEDDKSIVDEF